jgi:hypothetical protein
VSLVRGVMIACLRLKHQPQRRSRWFKRRTTGYRQLLRRITIIAMAPKVAVAL